MSAMLTQDEALALMLPLVPDHGWSMATLRMALIGAGGDPIDAEILFPGGPLELVEAFTARADAAMADGAPSLGLDTMKQPDRIKALVRLRLRLMHPHKEAVRRAVAVLATHPARAACVAGKTADTLWFLAGDTSADFNWYTKRASLAAVYTASLLFWLRDASEDDEATLDFLDRRLWGVVRAVKWRKAITEKLGRFLPAA